MSEPIEPQLPLHEPLTDQQVGDFAAAVGNHEIKALLCIAMEEGMGYRNGELNNLLVAIQGEDPVYHPSSAAGRLYNLDSFEPVDIVDVDFDSMFRGQPVSTFTKNSGNGRLASALSGHLLTASMAHPNVSLLEVFGQTAATSELRSSHHRIRIINGILDLTDAGRLVDIAPSLNHTIVSTHLKALADAGLITYESLRRGETYAEYELGDVSLDSLHLRAGRSPVPSAIRGYLLASEGADAIKKAEIVSFLKETYEECAAIPEAKLEAQVQRALERFTRKGALRRASKFANGYQQSEISITGEQRAVLRDFIEVINEFQTGDNDFIESGLEAARGILEDPQAVQDLMEKLIEKSPSMNKQARELTARRISGLLIDKPDGLVAADIRIGIGRPITEEAVRTVLGNMEKTGTVERAPRDRSNVIKFVLRAAEEPEEALAG